MKNYIILCITIGLLIPSASYSYCFQEAAVEYGVNPVVLQAISQVESGHKVTAVHRNKNGTEDRGHMQINSTWAKVLSGGWAYLTEDPCYCTKVGAWVLQKCMKRYGNTWDAIACYNSGRSTSELPVKTRMKVYEYIQKVQRQVKNQ